MDDIIYVVKRKEGEQLMEYFNAQHGRSKFRIEEERHGLISFTDIRFSRDEYGQVVRQVYRKPTHVSEVRSHSLPCPKSNHCVQHR